MDFLNEILLNLMCLLFPISIYIIGIAYFRNCNSNKNDLFLEAVLYSSLYLLIKLGSESILIYPMILLNVPLLVAYLKKSTRTAIVISIVLLIYYCNHTHILPVYLVLEYVIYFIVYKFVFTKEYNSIQIISIFVVIKSFIMAVEMYFIFDSNSNMIINFTLIYATMVIFTIIAYLILFFLNKGEEIMELNNVIHELEKEKKLRESLFKITHEIKNPIAVCKGYLDMMNYHDIDKVKKYTSIIKDEINRTLILMDDFLDYTKIQIEKDITDIYLLIEDTCDIVKPLFKKNSIKLKYDIPDEEVYMELDYNRLKQVLVNLLKNSIEAKDAKKDENYVLIQVENKKSEIVIKIKDNGIGMDKKNIRKSG